MAFEVNLCADDLKASEMQPGAHYLKGVDADVRRLHLRAVKDGLLVLVGPIADGLACFAALAEIIDIRPDALGAGDLVGLRLKGATANPDRIARFGQVLGLHE